MNKKEVASPRADQKYDESAVKRFKGFSDEERAAMKERTQELIAEARRGTKREDGESAVLAKIAVMSGSDRAMGERLHAIIKVNAPTLLPRTWYGMPAYANKDGKVICTSHYGQKWS